MSASCYPNTNQKVKIGDSVQYENPHAGWVNGIVIQTYDIPVFVVKDEQDQGVFVECKSDKLALPGTHKPQAKKKKQDKPRLTFFFPLGFFLVELVVFRLAV